MSVKDNNQRRERMQKLRQDGLTYAEIGREFGITRERVRQIKEKAIRRLRHASRSKSLRAYLN